MHSAHIAQWAGLAAPDAAHKDEGQAGTSGLAPRDQTTADEADFATLRAAEQLRVASFDKRVTSARARAALRSVVMHVMPGATGKPEFVFVRGGLSRSVDTIEAAEAWLDIIGAPK